MIHYINLTNGIDAIREYGLVDYRFMRLLSTDCEQKNWPRVVASIPDDMLMHLALGSEVYVYDYGANKMIPRSVWQGLEFIKTLLHDRWGLEPHKPVGRAAPGLGYFKHVLAGIVIDETRIRYYRQYLRTSRLRVVPVTGPTRADGDYDGRVAALHALVTQ